MSSSPFTKLVDMLQMVTPDEALGIVLNAVAPLASETISHADALGRTLAEDVVSDLELPPFANSAMDGYAVRCADVAQIPMTLTAVVSIAAGEISQRVIGEGEAARIMTGAPVPSGADAVVRREDTNELGDTVEILVAPTAGQSIRPAGDDVRPGETVLRAGEVIGPAAWGMLASLNRGEVATTRQPRVTILVTGEELAAIGAPLRPGQIRDSNSFTLSGLAQSCGVICTVLRVGDDTAAVQSALDEAASASDAIITSGGVSAGDFDPVRDVLLAGAEVHFWKIAMRPGKPVMFASWPCGGRRVPVFGLPGNPVSVMVTFEQFVRPALLKMQGRAALRRVELQATLAEPLRSPAGLTEFVRAVVTQNGTEWRAALTGNQSSGRLSTMTQANALLVVPAETTTLQAGQKITAQMIAWPEGTLNG